MYSKGIYDYHIYIKFYPSWVLLTQMFRRLYLKDKKFKCFTAATEEAIEALWEQLQKFGPPLGNDMKQPSLKKELKDRY